MPLRRGFTMIELLVVVAVIAVLAGILVPTVGMVRRMANDVKCGNNLQQIGGAILIYRNDNDDAFPGRLYDTDPNSKRDLFHSAGPLAGLTKILLCPRDLRLGTDPKMGRPSRWTDLSDIYTPNCSYDYEVSDHYLLSSGPDEIAWFFWGTRPATNAPESTWAAGKHEQAFFNNRPSSTVAAAPFPKSLFPILRCYNHFHWTGVAGPEDYTKKILNISWDLNVFWSTPYWEHDVNSQIAISH